MVRHGKSRRGGERQGVPWQGTAAPSSGRLRLRNRLRVDSFVVGGDLEKRWFRFGS